jgi:hypothetical protein
VDPHEQLLLCLVLLLFLLFLLHAFPSPKRLGLRCVAAAHQYWLSKLIYPDVSSSTSRTYLSSTKLVGHNQLVPGMAGAKLTATQSIYLSKGMCCAVGERTTSKHRVMERLQPHGLVPQHRVFGKRLRERLGGGPRDLVSLRTAGARRRRRLRRLGLIGGTVQLRVTGLDKGLCNGSMCREQTGASAHRQRMWI